MSTTGDHEALKRFIEWLRSRHYDICFYDEGGDGEMDYFAMSMDDVLEEFLRE